MLFSHAIDWVHHSLPIWVDCSMVLSDHFPLIVSWVSPHFAIVIPNGPKRLLTISSMFLNDVDFENCVATDILGLNVNLLKNPLNAWRKYVYRIQNLIRNYGEKRPWIEEI